MSDYKEKIRNMTWSYSRITAYDHCPYSFYLKYIIADDDMYLAESNFYAESGSYVHSILEKVLKGELSEENAAQYYLDHYDDNIFYKTRQNIMEKNFELCEDYLCNLDFDWLKDFEILGVEKEIHVVLKDENGNEYPFIGYIDLAVRHKETRKIYIIDHKSSSYPFKRDGKTVLKKSESDFTKYKMQMYLYAKAIFEEYGEYPEKLIWNHFKDQKVAVIPFDKDEYDKAIQWFIDKIHEIENDDEFEARCDFFYCNNLCDFRASCEYNERGTD